MARVTLILLAVVLVGLAADGRRIRRGFNNGGYGTSGYGRGSDERDASVSQENNGGCNSSNDRSGSRESAYNRDGRQSGQPARGGRTFTRSSASATATAAASAQHHKNNLVL